MEYRSSDIILVLNEYLHKRQDREIMTIYLTNRPASLRAIADECDVSLSTVKRTINKCSFIYKYLPEFEP